jgi:hypothetical protein
VGRVRRAGLSGIPLSEAAIIEAACRIIAAVGVDGFTIRELSDRLEHVPGRDSGERIV